MPACLWYTDFACSGRCLQVIYTADRVRLDLIELAMKKHDLISVHGNVLFDHCEDLRSSQPITFSTEDAFIFVPGVRNLGSIQFQFRTNEPNGLLMYAIGIDGSGGTFLIEIVDGFVFLILDVSSKWVRVKGSSVPVNDSSFHFVSLEHDAGVFSIDRKSQHYNRSIIQMLHGELYVGGISSNHRVSIDVKFGRLNRGYVGCMQHLVVGTDTIDLASLAMEQRQEGIGRYCHSPTPHCQSQPCHHRGVCMEGWNRYLCDCLTTNYTGDTCKEGKRTLDFLCL